MMAQAMGLSPERLYFPVQVHKTNIVTVTSSTRKEALLETDALLTAEKGVATIPVAAFYSDQVNNQVLRFCFAKKESTLEAAVERLTDL